MIEVSNLTKSYENFTLNCSISVPSGTVTGLIGQNGAGKSTAFKAILGLINPDGGSIKIFGKDNTRLTAKDRQRIGVALSDSGFSSYLSISDIADILKHSYDSFDSSRFFGLCDKFRLPTKKRTKEFSTGMKARLKLLIAICHNASLLILDEPTLGLDVMARNELLDLLRDYMDEDDSRSILISSHISSDLETLCDDIYMIDNGSIILHEDTDVLLNNYALIKLSPQQFEHFDKKYIIQQKKESFGYSCLTNERQYYLENFPDAVIEKSNIDTVITMMIGGEKI